jgi:hypothetical protein
MATMGLGPNAVQPCPSDGHRRTMLAHGRICPVCEPDEQWTDHCPVCSRPAPMVGLTVQPHRISYGRGPVQCHGAGRTVAVPTIVVRPIWREGMPRLGIVRSRLRLVPAPGGDAA